MSEQPTSAAARPPGSRPPGKTYAGLSRNQWLIVGGVFVAALGYLWWRRRQASQAAGSQSGAANVGSNECTDANGNPVDCNELFAQELAAMQNSLDQLGAQSGGGGATTGGTAGSSGGTATGDGGGGTTVTPPPATPGTSSGGGTRTAARTAGTITGLKASSVTRTSFKASWNPASNAQGYAYIVRDLATHTQAGSGQTTSTSVTVSGLRPGVDYNFGVQALPGGRGDNIHVRTK